MKKKELGICNLGNTWLRKEKSGMIIGFNNIDIHISMWKLQRRGVWFNSLTIRIIIFEWKYAAKSVWFSAREVIYNDSRLDKRLEPTVFAIFFLSKILWFLIMLQLKMMMQIYIYWHGKMPMTYCWVKNKTGFRTVCSILFHLHKILCIILYISVEKCLMDCSPKH